MKDYRSEFILPSQNSYIYLDSAATTCKLKIVYQTILHQAQHSITSGHNASTKEGGSLNEQIEVTKKQLARLLQAPDPAEIHFCTNASTALNFVAVNVQRWLRKEDQILLTRFEHKSSDDPWKHVCQATGAKIKLLTSDDYGYLAPETILPQLDQHSKVLILTLINNITGARQQVATISKLVRASFPDIIIVCDATQAMTTTNINLQTWNIDFFVFSGHKMYGGFGVGGVWCNGQKWHTKLIPLTWGGGVDPVNFKATLTQSSSEQLVSKENCAIDCMISSEEHYHKFFAGTPNYYAIVSLTQAINWIMRVGTDTIHEHIAQLRKHFLSLWNQQLASNFIFYNQHCDGSHIILLNHHTIHAHDLGAYLNQENIIVRVGGLCARRFSSVLKAHAVVRISIQIYNTINDIEMLISALSKIKLAKTI